MEPGCIWKSATTARTLASVSSGWSPGTKRHPATPGRAFKPSRTVSDCRAPAWRTQRTPMTSQSSSTSAERVTTTTSSKSSGSAESVRSRIGTPASGSTSFWVPKRRARPEAMTTQPMRGTSQKPEKHSLKLRRRSSTHACSNAS